MDGLKLQVVTGSIVKDECLDFSLFDFSSILEFNNPNYFLFPGFLDVHVHFREPGFFIKESIQTGSIAASKGGYSAVCTMPNLNPVPDSIENLKVQLDIIERDSVIDIYPYGAITKDEKGIELSDFDGLKDKVIAFSDDGKGVQEREMMKKAMIKAKSLNKIIVAHCEVNSLLNGGYIHDGKYAKLHGHKGISSSSEYEQIKRDIELSKKTGCKYHVCHISTKESVELIREAKRCGVDITCETAPHYLLLDDSYLEEDGKWKMNPPLRDETDRLALIEGIKDGTIDMIATDHAPHTKEEKSNGLQKSPFGISGIEIAFPLLYTYLVKTNIITLDKLIDLIANNPRKRFNIPYNGFSIWSLGESEIINPNNFLSKGKSTPFENWKVDAINHITVVNNKIVYKRK